MNILGFHSSIFEDLEHLGSG